MMSKGKSSSKKISASFRKLAQADLDIAPTWIPDQALQAIIDDWLVPAMVNEYLRSKKETRGSDEQKHNGDQLP
jgi:hypothetical protein